jgi:DNA-binding FadR family transcriptional regulator
MRVRGLDASFHLAIARATHNVTLIGLMQTLQQRLRLARHSLPVAEEAWLTIEIHERTAQAIATPPHSTAPFAREVAPYGVSTTFPCIPPRSNRA